MAKLVRWDPFREISTVRDSFDRLLSRMHDVFSEGQTWSPAVDIEDHGDNLIVKAELPGIDKKDINVSVTEDTLTISGKTQEEKKEKRGKVLYQERNYGSFVRSFTLPAEVNREKVKATYKDGVLEITLPKKEEAKAKETKVEIE